jgi:septal ring factor EnvC (AmiA/AmiB activator)
VNTPGKNSNDAQLLFRFLAGAAMTVILGLLGAIWATNQHQMDYNTTSVNEVQRDVNELQRDVARMNQLFDEQQRHFTALDDAVGKNSEQLNNLRIEIVESKKSQVYTDRSIRRLEK